MGDGAEVGCNAVPNPGTLLGPRAMVAPAIAFGGYLAAGHFGRPRYVVSDKPRQD
jgi:hypothetical protein